MVVKNALFSVAGPGEKLARRSLFLAAPGAGVLLAQSLAAQTPAPAAAPPSASLSAPRPFKVGVLNAEQALASTKDGQKAQAELEQKLGPRYAELQKLNADIQGLQKQLDQGGNIMSQSTKTDLQNSIQTKTRSLQRQQQDFQDEEQKQRSVVLADLYTKMQEVITKYAADNGFSLILNVGQDNTPVLWVSNDVEITQAIIEAYDKAAPAAPKALAPAKPPATAAPKPSTSAPPPAKPPVAPAAGPGK
jgi:outer membrane protein